jgi:hypothetical protein
MTCYIVSFEVLTPAARGQLVAALKTYSGYCPINANCWAVLSDKTPLDIHNHLRPTVQPTDRLFVIRSGTAAAWSNPYAEANNDWLKKQL